MKPERKQRRSRRVWLRVVLALVVAGLAIGGVVGYRAWRLYTIATDMRSQVKHLIQSGGDIGTASADSTLSADYLAGIFGSDPELLAKLRSIVDQGLSDSPALNLGEVAAMIVTYHRNSENKVEDVAAHIVGGFSLNQKRLGFHRNGYFRGLIDNNLWRQGNSMVGFLGRDVVLFADEQVIATQKHILDALLNGDILPLVNSLNDPLYYTVVLPNPKRLVPGPLRKHIQAIVIKGNMSKREGQSEVIILTPSGRAASYTLSVLRDMKIASEVALKTKWKGVVQQREWGPVIDPWWSFEMVKASENAVLEREENIVRYKTKYQRVMVNVLLKSLERMGRDLAQMRMSLAEHMDPRLVDAAMATRKPGHYWSDPHRWGPNWPIAAPTNEIQNAEATESDQVHTTDEDTADVGAGAS